MQNYPSRRPSALCWFTAAITLFSVISGSSAESRQQSADWSRQTKALMQWAEDSKLAAEWQFPRELRRIDHPSGVGEAWTLDVRFKHLPSEPDDDQEIRRFEKFMTAYHRSQGLSFPDKVFYKFVQIFDLPQEDAVVHFHIGTNDLAVFVNRESGGLISRLRKSRFAQESASIKLPEDLPQARNLRATVRKTGTTVDWPPRIRDFLEDYFRKANLNARLPEPRIVPNCRGNHVGLTVSGLRSQVFTNGMYWEKIQVETDVWAVTDGIQVSANIDGSYASGVPGFGLPSDYPGNADHDYPKELKDFSNVLFDKLTQAIKRGTP